MERLQISVSDASKLKGPDLDKYTEYKEIYGAGRSSYRVYDGSDPFDPNSKGLRRCVTYRTAMQKVVIALANECGIDSGDPMRARFMMMALIDKKEKGDYTMPPEYTMNTELCKYIQAIYCILAGLQFTGLLAKPSMPLSCAVFNAIIRKLVNTSNIHYRVVSRMQKMMEALINLKGILSILFDDDGDFNPQPMTVDNFNTIQENAYEDLELLYNVLSFCIQDFTSPIPTILIGKLFKNWRVEDSKIKEIAAELKAANETKKDSGASAFPLVIVCGLGHNYEIETSDESVKLRESLLKYLSHLFDFVATSSRFLTFKEANNGPVEENDSRTNFVNKVNNTSNGSQIIAQYNIKRPRYTGGNGSVSYDASTQYDINYITTTNQTYNRDSFTYFKTAMNGEIIDRDIVACISNWGKLRVNTLKLHPIPKQEVDRLLEQSGTMDESSMRAVLTEMLDKSTIKVEIEDLPVYQESGSRIYINPLIAILKRYLIMF